MAERIVIEGVDKAIRNLNALKRSTQKKVMGKAARAGGAVILKAVRAHAPKMNNRLKRSLIQIVRRPKSGAYSMIGQDMAKINKQVGKRTKKGSGGISGQGNVVPIHLVDQPTRPHTVHGKPFLAFDGLVVRSIRHPGTRGKHFMRQAARSSERAAVDAYFQKTKTEVAIEVAKLVP